MIADMIVWGFFSAIGWMSANWTVEKIFPDSQPQIEKKIETIEKKLDNIDNKLKVQEKKDETK
ncbi:MAG: hypothetical protein EBU90_20960 [Proteobacteria bacterium]|nr:hypothetical protein [Pseudomonadota bacterium]